MKKTLLFAACALLLAACTSNPTKEAIKLLDETTKRIENCTSIDELQQINATYLDQYNTLQQTFPADMSSAEQNELRQASQKYSEAVAQKIQELGGEPAAVQDVVEGVDSFNAEPVQKDAPETEQQLQDAPVGEEAGATMN